MAALQKAEEKLFDCHLSQSKAMKFFFQQKKA